MNLQEASPKLDCLLECRIMQVEFEPEKNNIRTWRVYVLDGGARRGCKCASDEEYPLSVGI